MESASNQMLSAKKITIIIAVIIISYLTVGKYGLRYMMADSVHRILIAGDIDSLEFRNALIKISQNEDPDTLKYALRASESKVNDTQLFSIQILGNIQDRASFNKLKELVDSGQLVIRAAALANIVKLDFEESWDYVTKNLNDEKLNIKDKLAGYIEVYQISKSEKLKKKILEEMFEDYKRNDNYVEYLNVMLNLGKYPPALDEIKRRFREKANAAIVKIGVAKLAELDPQYLNANIDYALTHFDGTVRYAALDAVSVSCPKDYAVKMKKYISLEKDPRLKAFAQEKLSKSCRRK